MHYETKLYQKIQKANRYGAYEGDSAIVFAPKYQEECKSPLFYLLNHAPLSGFCLGFYGENCKDDNKMFEADNNTIQILNEWNVKIRNYQ